MMVDRATDVDVLMRFLMIYTTIRWFKPSAWPAVLADGRVLGVFNELFDDIYCDSLMYCGGVRYNRVRGRYRSAETRPAW